MTENGAGAEQPPAASDVAVVGNCDNCHIMLDEPLLALRGRWIRIWVRRPKEREVREEIRMRLEAVRRDFVIR